MKNHHEVGHFKNRLMIVLLSLFALVLTAGQSFAADCTTCHGMPPLDSSDGSRNPGTGAFKGSHQTHTSAGLAGECVRCHNSAGHTNSHAKTDNFNISMSSNIFNSASTARYSKPLSFPTSSTPTLGTCRNVNCHFEKVTPLWGKKPTDPVATNCNTCHATPRGTAYNGSHAVHEAYYGGLNSCSKCHPNYNFGSYSTTASESKFSHATSAGKHKIVVNTLMNYAGGTTISWLPSQTKVFGSCSNVSCHGNGKGVYNNPTWGVQNIVGCALCHPNLSPGHAKHVSTLQAEISFYAYTSNKSTRTANKFGCANCHPLAVAKHIDGAVDVDMTNNVAGGSLKAKNGAWTYVSSQCNNVYCHSNGYKPGASYTFALTPAWGTSFTGDPCAACHGNSPNSVPATQPGSLAHTAHAVGIHYDDIFNGVSKKLPLGGGTAINAAHGKNSRSTTINCNICHSITVATFANDQNATCSFCHKVGGSPAPLFGNMSVSSHTKHVNGVVDVNFINQKIATKAQVVTTAFAAYTANASGWNRRSNAMKFKTYTSSYDYTKSTLSAGASPYTTGAGCLNIACHASITVKWTDTVTCNSCHVRLK